MPDSDAHVTLEQAQPALDFACCWRIEGRPWYRLRVPSHQFLLVDEGQLEARSAGPTLHAGPGDLLCLGRTPHSDYGYMGRVRYWETHASFAPPPHQRLPLWLDGKPIPERVPLGTHAAAARAAFEAMCRWIDRPGDAARARVRAAMFELLAAIAAALGRRPAQPRRTDPWQRARAELESGFQRQLALTTLARELALSENHFIRGFRRRFGITPMAYRAQARLRAAADELADGTAPVKEIARRLGFTDDSAFARAFRRQFGASPSDWRAQDVHRSLPAVVGEEPFPINRHIRPPGFDGNYRWG
jgi:AraC-like DNA-binding protein